MSEKEGDSQDNGNQQEGISSGLEEFCYDAGHDAATQSIDPMETDPLANIIDQDVNAGLCVLSGNNDAYAQGYEDGAQPQNEPIQPDEPTQPDEQ